MARISKRTVDATLPIAERDVFLWDQDLKGFGLRVKQTGVKSFGSEWVIRGRKPGRPLVNLAKPWSRVRERAGLEDVRLHDLRHTHASVGASIGLGLPILARVMGHRSHATTNRYINVGGADRNSQTISAVIVGGRMFTQEALQTLKVGAAEAAQRVETIEDETAHD